MSCDHCVQLHTHSSLSFKDGLPSEDGIVAKAYELDQPGVGLTNHGHLYGAQRFFKACAKYNVKGVIGTEIYEAVPHTWDTDPDGPGHALFKGKWTPGLQRYFHLTLWAMNQEGWENLCALHTQSFTKPYKPKNQPLIDRASLERHSAGIIVGLGCINSRVNQAWVRGEGDNAAYKAADWYFETFEDRVYVEVMANVAEQVSLLVPQRKLAKRYGRPTVGTNDVHYLERADGVKDGSHHTLIKARKWRSSASAEAESDDQSDDSFGSWYGSDEYFMKTRAEMVACGIQASEVDASMEILDRVTFDFDGMPDPKPPAAPVPEPGQDPEFDAWLALHA